MSSKTLNKKLKSPYDEKEIKERNKYAENFIQNLRKLKKGEVNEVEIDYTKIKIKQSVKLIKLNINDKLVLITDKGGRYFLNDRRVSQIMQKQMDGDLESTEQHDDDYDETQDLTTAKPATLKVIKGDVKSKPGGGFFLNTLTLQNMTLQDIIYLVVMTN